MSENETELELEIEDDDESEKEKPKPKSKLTPEQELGIKKRKFKDLAKELGIDLTPKSEKSSEPVKETNGLDLEEMFFEMKGVHEEDRDFVKKFSQAEGTTLTKAFQMEELQTVLTKRNDMRASALAIPDGTKRVAAPARDDVGYWIAKGELPPKDSFTNRELRRKVVLAKVERAKTEGRNTGRHLLPDIM